MIRLHEELTLVVPPRVARPVGVDLDAEPVRIGEIHRFADEMIGHPGVRADLTEVRDESSERRSIGEENCEVVETEQSAPRNRTRSRVLVEVDDLSIFTMRAQSSRIGAPPNDAHAEDIGVELDRPLEISDLQPNSAEMRRFRQ